MTSASHVRVNSGTGAAALAVDSFQSRHGTRGGAARRPSAGARRSRKAASEAKVAQVWSKESMANVGKQGRGGKYAHMPAEAAATATTLMKRLMENQYMADHVEDRLERDRQDYLDTRLLKGKPRIFKNYVETNSNQLRK